MKTKKIVLLSLAMLGCLTSCAKSGESALKHIYYETESSDFLGNPNYVVLTEGKSEDETILIIPGTFSPSKAGYTYSAITGVYFNKKGFDKGQYDVVLSLQRNDKTYYEASSYLPKTHEKGVNSFYFDVENPMNGYQNDFDTRKELLGQLCSWIDEGLSYIIDGYQEEMGEDFKVILPNF